MKVSEIKKFIENLADDQEIYVGYDDKDELDCELYTEQDIIDKANAVRCPEEDYDEDDEDENDEDENDEDDEDEITDIDYALQYLAEMNEDYHFMW